MTAQDQRQPPPPSTPSPAGALAAVTDIAPLTLDAQTRRAPVRRPRGTVARWNADWQRRSAAITAATITRWGERHPCLAGLGSAPGVLAGCGEDPSVAWRVADQRLAAVVAEATTGDLDAARLAIQRVFAGLITRSAVLALAHGLEGDDVLDDLLAAAWMTIIRYPLARRPVKIAVNIIKDAESHIFGYVPVTVRRSIVVAPDLLLQHPAIHTTAAAGSGEPDAGLVPRLLREAIGQEFTTEHARLLARLEVLGLSVDEIAHADGVSDRWVRKCRQQAITQLRVAVS